MSERQPPKAEQVKSDQERADTNGQRNAAKPINASLKRLLAAGTLEISFPNDHRRGKHDYWDLEPECLTQDVKPGPF